jgi:hypothetical protein
MDDWGFPKSDFGDCYTNRPRFCIGSLYRLAAEDIAAATRLGRRVTGIWIWKLKLCEKNNQVRIDF